MKWIQNPMFFFFKMLKTLGMFKQIFPGLSVLNKLDNNVYDKLESISKKIHDGLLNNIIETNTDAIINRNGSMLTMFFTKKKEINSTNT